VASLRAVHELAERRGHAAGATRAQNDLAGAVAAAGALAERLEAELPRDASALAEIVTTLAMAVARRILEGEISADPARLIAVLERAIATVNGSPDVRVLLHPATVKPIREAWEASHGTAYLGKTWHFEADRSLPRGGCVLRYHHGFVDAGIETQLRTISEALEGQMPALASRGGVKAP
jgi:flagellar assembly protein FliH